MRRLASLPVLLAAGCAAVSLGILFRDIAATDDAGIRVLSGPDPAVQSTALAGTPPIDPSIYSEIAARPLFVSSRRPPPASVSIPTTLSLPPLDFSLIGIVDAPGQDLALLEESDKQAADLVHIGSVVNGWTVIKINENSIDVRTGSTSRTVKIMQ